MTTTLAYVLEKANAPFVLQTVVLDELRPSEVLVEINYTGLCHTVCYHLTNFSFDKSNTSDQTYVGHRRPRRRHANRPLPRRLGSRRHWNS
jgi:D-arabinose 1-dehydrogenase-like Zn-dependent alcohol dehydrogenase